jgi:transitional endoplasmic reticulum ATPase
MTDETYEFESSPVVGLFARIVYIAVDRTVMHFEPKHGNIQTVHSASGDLVGERGDIIIVTNDEYTIVPSDLWRDETTIGVIRSQVDDVIVVDTGTRVATFPAGSEVEFGFGDTVEVSEHHGVLRVLNGVTIPSLGRETDIEELLQRVRTKDFTDADSLDAIGGLTSIIEEARRLVVLPIEHPERFKALGGSPIKGVLLTGDPGLGKTMLARALAREAGAAFYNIRGPELSSMWRGESERILRKIFEDAGDQDRAIIFFDEFDSIGGQRSEHAHEASRHLVAQLLTLMDGFTPYQNVVVIAATNRVEDVDKALRRPGRFDWELAFPYPTASDRADILRKSANGVALADDLPIHLVAARTEGWTGAELAGIWREAVLVAAVDDRPLVSAEDLIVGYERAAAHRARRTPERRTQ